MLDVTPPNPPWIPFVPREHSGAALSYYYSDPNSTIPVREVTRADDNKADPNMETMTYGMFTTCERGMRAGMVRDGRPYIFFCTNRGGRRVLTGYYLIGWYCKGPPIKGYRRAGGSVPHDYILAASRMKFVDPGFPLTQLTPYLGRKRVDTPFRTFRYIDSEMARLLRELIDGTPDATESYLGEIRRLEKLNLAKYGYRYRNWKREEGFTWSAAPPFLGIEQ